MWLWGEYVYHIHIRVRCPSVLNLFNVCEALVLLQYPLSKRPTCNVLIENIIFLNNIVYDLLATLVQD
jgi:hypothetical protein